MHSFTKYVLSIWHCVRCWRGNNDHEAYILIYELQEGKDHACLSHLCFPVPDTYWEPCKLLLDHMVKR